MIKLALLFTFASTGWASPRPVVEADERVELAAALHLLATRAGALPGFLDDGSDYARALLSIATPAARHPAVDAYRRMLLRPASGGAGYMSALRELTLCLDHELLVRRGHACSSSPLAGPAASFAAATDFAARWRERARPLFAADVDALAASRDRADLVALFENYTGIPISGSQSVVPSPLLAPGFFWNGLMRAEGATGYAIVTVLSPSRRAASEERFDWTPVMRDVWHENAHALLDPWLDSQPSTGTLSHPGLSGRTLADCYGSWPQCVREHAAQGLSAAILSWARRGGRLPFYADEHLKESLPLLPQVLTRLREYEADRRRYPTIREFYPRLLEVLEGPRLVPAVPSGKADGRNVAYERALAAYAAGRAVEAAEELRAITRVDERQALAWLSLAVVEGSLGRAAQARRAAGRAVLLGRTDGLLSPEFLSDALSTQAELRLAAGDVEGARQDWREALDSAPSDWPRAAAVRSRLGVRAPEQ